MSEKNFLKIIFAKEKFSKKYFHVNAYPFNEKYA